MLHTITKRLEICIDVNIKMSKVDHYTWIFTSSVFRLALEITFLLKYFYLQMSYELLAQSGKLNKPGSPNKNRRVGKFYDIMNMSGFQISQGS